MKAVEISDNAIFFFALFLLRRNTDGSFTLVRKLMDFESPFISLRTSSDCEIVIRKNYWDESFDLDLMRDRIAMNLLYIQAISDVERSWIATNGEIRQKLSLLQSVGNKNDYMAVVRALPYYGCLHFSNVNCDFPELKTNASIIVGNSELIIKTVIGVNQFQETKFRVTRMRSWRITTIHNEAVVERRMRINENHKSYTFELSFEYLMAKNSLRWIKLVTEQAMLISVCLQVGINFNYSSNANNSFNCRAWLTSCLTKRTAMMSTIFNTHKRTINNFNLFEETIAAILDCQTRRVMDQLIAK